MKNQLPFYFIFCFYQTTVIIFFLMRENVSLPLHNGFSVLIMIINLAGRVNWKAVFILRISQLKVIVCVFFLSFFFKRVHFLLAPIVFFFISAPNRITSTPSILFPSSWSDRLLFLTLNCTIYSLWEEFRILTLIYIKK